MLSKEYFHLRSLFWSFILDIHPDPTFSRYEHNKLHWVSDIPMISHIWRGWYILVIKMSLVRSYILQPSPQTMQYGKNLRHHMIKKSVEIHPLKLSLKLPFKKSIAFRGLRGPKNAKLKSLKIWSLHCQCLMFQHKFEKK